MRWNKGIKTMYDRMRQCIITNVHYVVWQQILFRELLRKNVDQSQENIC
jgi:hypothetical protein